MKRLYTNIKQEIKNYFKQQQKIDFVLLFGSFCSGNLKKISDIDIAIHTYKKFDLLEIGKIISDLEKISDRKIDILELNDLYKVNPLLAYRVISNCESIVVHNSKSLTDFKRNTFLYYLDTERMRTEFRKNFSRRIEQKKFGQYNYA